MVPRFFVSAECQSIGTIGKKQRAVARSKGLVIQPQKLSVGAYFELSFLGFGFLIHLSNRSDSPRFRAPWKKIRQKYGTRQEPYLFKGHPLSCQYGEALCSMVHSLVSWPSAKAQEPLARSRGLVIQSQKLSVGAYFELSFLGCGFLTHLSNRYDSPRFRAPWKKIRQKYDIQQELSLFKGHPLSCQYGDALCSMIPT